MKSKAKAIAKIDAQKLIDELNSAVADEWLAHYQYWATAQVMKGLDASAIHDELLKISNQELEHATELTCRLIQLGGTPIPHPSKFIALANCEYIEPPKDRYNVKQAVKDVVKAEGCAIGYYNSLIRKIKDKDEVTYNLLLHILLEEVKHEQTFNRLL